MPETIIWKIQNNIGHIILNDPPSNKMTLKFFDRLRDIEKNIIPKNNIRALIIYGSGRHFSSGADLNDLFNNILENICYDENGKISKYPNFLEANIKSFLFFETLDIPVIGIANGVCLGSALELFLFCHIRLCTKKALFGFPETSFNLIPGCGGTQKILEYMSYSKALELILTGKNLGAEEALHYNIVDKIIPKNEIKDFAEKLVDDIHLKYNKKNIKQLMNKDSRTIKIL